MIFQIIITQPRGPRLVFNVEKLPSTQSLDYYKIIGRNGFMVLSSNAPVMRRNNLKYRKPQWKVVENPIWNATFRELIITKLQHHLDSMGQK